LFGRAIESATQGITIADARQEDEPLIYANEAFTRITGYPTAEVIGRNCRFLQGEGTDEETVAKIRRAIDEGAPVSVELLNYRKDGTPFWNRLEIVPVADETGDPTHFLGLQRDITERKRREQQLSVLYRVLRHNLRNQMNVILGNVSLLRESDAPEAIVEDIDDAATELLSVSEQIQQFRGLVGVDTGATEAIDIATAAREAVEATCEAYPDASLSVSGPPEAFAEVHASVPSAIEEYLRVVCVEPSDRPEAVVEIEESDGEFLVRLIERSGAIGQEEISILNSGVETPMQHLQGLELWFLRWAVLSSGGDFSANCIDGETELRLRLLAAETNVESG
ncbi:MAG: PAS domain-containing protein, partial [Natronomonas sp.]